MDGCWWNMKVRDTSECLIYIAWLAHAPTPLVLSPDCRGGAGRGGPLLPWPGEYHRQDLWITSKLCREGGGSSGQCCPQYTGNKLSRASLRLIRCLIFYLPQPRGILCVERSVHAVFARWLPGQQGVRPVVTRWSELVTRCDIEIMKTAAALWPQHFLFPACAHCQQCLLIQAVILL